jgi:type II secretory pathway pseudopilin PulG
MRDKSFNAQSGISIIEILAVITVLSVLTIMAVMQLGRSRTHFQRQRIAREFKVNLERARFDSVKRRANAGNEMAGVILNNSKSFTAITDMNQNGKTFNADGTAEASDSRVVNFTDRSDAQILVSDTLNYPITILFNQRGLLTATDKFGNAVNPVFTICSNKCTEASKESTVISISTTGTVAVLNEAPSATATPLPAPSPITSSTPKFNCYILVNSNTACF